MEQENVHSDAMFVELVQDKRLFGGTGQRITTQNWSKEKKTCFVLTVAPEYSEQTKLLSLFSLCDSREWGGIS